MARNEFPRCGCSEPIPKRRASGWSGWGRSTIGFERVGEVKLPEQGLRGIRFDSAGETILALEPDGPGPAADALKQRGPHIYGISIAVADIGLARRIAEWGYGREMKSYRGLLGESYAAPTHSELGFVMEFHQSPAP